MIPGSIPLILAGGSNQYSVAKSMRFRTGSSALYKTLSSSGNVDKWTYSVWIKRTDILGVKNSYNVLLAATIGGNPYYQSNFMINSSDQLTYYQFTNSSGYTVNVSSTGLLRDTSAWYHIVLKYDRLGSNMVAWVNNSEFINTSSYSTSIQYINSSSATQYIGNYTYQSDPSGNFDGYMAEVNFIDNQALTPSSFGQTDSTTGVWVPKKYLGTYTGTSGYLQFANSSNFGVDTSGLANNWTQYAGVASTDQMTDTPTLNYAVWSQIDRGDTGLNLANGNLGYTISNAVSGFCRASFATSTGKWYWELTAGADWTASPQHGISPITAVNTGDATSGGGYGFESAATSRLFANGAATGNYGSQINSGDVLMIAVDFDAGKIWYGKNGTWFGSPAGDPAAGTNQSQTISTGVTYAPMFGRDSSNATTTNYANFGQRPFAYTPPSGFKALNTANLPVPSIRRPNQYFDITLRSGTSANANVTSLAFQPDFLWIKARDKTFSHNLFDSSRGGSKGLYSDQLATEYTDGNTLISFTSSGYFLGDDENFKGTNATGYTYVDWSWKESVTSGFDIVTYVGNGTNRTISHNLGAVPKLIIVRSREATSTGRWLVQHGTYGAARYAYLNEIFAFDTGNANLRWNSTDPTSSVFSLGTSSDGNHTGDNYVGYLFAEIAGFSRISSYTGNGSSDGPFVWCGFRPSFVMIKRGDSTENWSIQDDARSPFNVVDARLKPNSTDVEAISSVQNVDFLANGFKIRNTDTEKNASGGTYIFAAFAKTPFKYARAR